MAKYEKGFSPVPDVWPSMADEIREVGEASRVLDTRDTISLLDETTELLVGEGRVGEKRRNLVKRAEHSVDFYQDTHGQPLMGTTAHIEVGMPIGIIEIGGKMTTRTNVENREDRLRLQGPMEIEVTDGKFEMQQAEAEQRTREAYENDPDSPIARTVLYNLQESGVNIQPEDVRLEVTREGLKVSV